MPSDVLGDDVVVTGAGWLPSDVEAVAEVELKAAAGGALTLGDVEATPAGLLLTVLRSKTNPKARGKVVGVAHGRRPATDPVAALDT